MSTFFIEIGIFCFLFEPIVNFHDEDNFMEKESFYNSRLLKTRVTPYLCMHLKFIYSEKATRFCKISTLLLSVCTVDKVRWRFRKILWPSQNIRTLENNAILYLSSNF